MAETGQVIEAPNGVKLRIEQLDDELLAMEATYPGDGVFPPEHLHPRQDEHFEVLEGEVHAIVDGTETRHGPGDAFDVPAGTPHQMAAMTPSRFRWEVRPALRTAEFFEVMYSGNAGPDFLEEFSDEFRLTGD